MAWLRWVVRSQPTPTIESTQPEPILNQHEGMHRRPVQASVEQKTLSILRHVIVVVAQVGFKERDRLADLQPQWDEAMQNWDGMIEYDVDSFTKSAGPAVIVPDWE